MDPALGRFISEDPARDGSNWFVYYRNNPVNMVDQDGKVAGPVAYFYQAIAGTAGVILGTAAGYLGMVNAIRAMDPKWQPDVVSCAAYMFETGFSGLAVAYVVKHTVSKHPVSLVKFRAGLGLAGTAGYIAGSYAGALAAAVEYLTSPSAVE